MDQIKIGKFIAELRCRDGLTQEALGEKLGVTNKTVSRWENGNYMPDIETFQLLSEVFGVSINELLSGRLLSDGEFRKTADENIVKTVKESAFSRAETVAFLKKKWLKDHVSLIVLCALLFAAFCAYVYIKKYIILSALTPLIAAALYGFLHNKMMIYVEKRL